MGSENNEIWMSFKSGDEKGLQRIYNTFYTVLLNYGHKFTHDQSLIEESIQLLFVKMWKNRKNLNEPASLKHYLLKAFRNTLVQKLQSQAKEEARISSFENLEFSLVPPHEDLLIRREEADLKKLQLKRILDTLTNRQKEAVYLRFYEELSYEEVAAILEMNVGGVYKLVYRAIDRLREASKEHPPF